MLGHENWGAETNEDARMREMFEPSNLMKPWRTKSIFGGRTNPWLDSFKKKTVKENRQILKAGKRIFK